MEELDHGEEDECSRKLARRWKALKKCRGLNLMNGNMITAYHVRIPGHQPQLNYYDKQQDCGSQIVAECVTMSSITKGHWIIHDEKRGDCGIPVYHAKH